MNFFLSLKGLFFLYLERRSCIDWEEISDVLLIVKEIFDKTKKRISFLILFSFLKFYLIFLHFKQIIIVLFSIY